MIRINITISAKMTTLMIIVIMKITVIKTVIITVITAIIIAFIDVNSFGRCLTGGLTGIQLALNIAQTLMMTACVIATIGSGADYLKDIKKYI